jgi:tetratricopeptide (TPR) repeat protein
LLIKGNEILEFGDGSPDAAKYLGRAVAMRGDDSAAQGLLACELMATADGISKNGAAVDAAQRAVAASLRLDPSDANARLAQIELQRTTLDLVGTEDRLRAVLAAAPNNIFAMRMLWNLLQSAGRSYDALATVQRAIAVKPLAAANNFPLAQLLWIVGRTAEADRVIDHAMQFWPTHRYVRFARFTIFAFTGRPRAALAMLDESATRPQNFSPASISLWRRSLPALDRRTAANVARARQANLDGVSRDPKLASQAVLSLCALGEVDAAFEVANSLLMFEVRTADSPAKPLPQSRASSTAWRFTPWLFTPPAAALRADPRFTLLCDAIGLSAYWTRRGIRPDYQVS